MNFERNKTVKESLDLGIFAKRTFQTDNEAAEFILSVLPQILLNGDRENHNHLRILQLYVIEYIMVQDGFYNTPKDIADPSLMWLIEYSLHKFGYGHINKINPHEFKWIYKI